MAIFHREMQKVSQFKKLFTTKPSFLEKQLYKYFFHEVYFSEKHMPINRTKVSISTRADTEKNIYI